MTSTGDALMGGPGLLWQPQDQDGQSEVKEEQEEARERCKRRERRGEEDPTSLSGT